MNSTASSIKVNNVSAGKLPKSLVEAIRYFEDPDVCVDYIAKLRWPDGPVCPTCGGTEHSYLTTRRLWKCRACKRQFSVKVGTIFEDSPIKLKNWLAAIWLIANSKNGISSYELGRAVGLSQKSAWHVLHRIRHAMRTGNFDRFEGEVEADETYVGGKTGNMHRDVRERRTRTGMHDKTMVVGAVRRASETDPSQVAADVIHDTAWYSPRAFVRRTVDDGANLYTDSSTVYAPMKVDFKHETVNHSQDEYVRGRVHTNGIENFWSLLKRGIHGTYVQVNPEHLHRYVDERVFTYNLRHTTDYERFQTVLRRSVGRRLTWNELTGADDGSHGL